MHLEDIMDTRLLQEMIDRGFVKVQTHPDDSRYKIFNYTDLCTYSREWNAVTRECRGLITFTESEAQKAVVLARPFPKFFNAGEKEADKFRTEERVRVSDKVDGSLGILYTAPDGRPAIATRGSFASPQALHATALYRERYEGTWEPTPRYTYLFEVVYPDNRIVLDYGQQDDLILLGDRAIGSGTIDSPEWAVRFEGWTGPVAQSFGRMTYFEAARMANRQNAEGLVIRNGRKMVKIKQDDYIALHKIVFGLTEKAVWERLRYGDTVFQICDGLPDEFHPWVGEVSGRLLKEFMQIYLDANSIYRTFRRGIEDVTSREGKKAYAEKVMKSGYAHIGLLFMLRDEKDIGEAIWDLIKPSHRPYTTTNVQEQEAA